MGAGLQAGGRPRWLSWAAAALVAAVGVWAYVHFGLGRYLTLETLKTSHSALVGFYTAHPVQTALVYFALYVAAIALSVPGATILTLAAGAIFGLGMGTLLVSFASTLGATLAFLVARYLLRDAVQRRFGQRLKSVNEGIRRDGVWYLLTLRLVPAFPFFLVNLLAALTPVGVGRFYWVSQLGMLPGTLVYVNAGTQLATIERLSDVLSPALLGSFILLGLFPLLAKAAVDWARRRKVYAGWTRPKHFDRNLVVIGAGSAGLVTAYIAATVRAKVTLVEGDRMGGDCLNTGCVPSKALIRSAKLAAQARNGADYGLRADVQVDFAAVMARVHRVIADIEPHDSIERYTRLGVDVVQGHARITSPWTVEIDTAGTKRTLTTRSIVVATGAGPFVPPIPGLAEVGYLTSETLWQLRALPRRLVVLGGGPIGCELAQAFARLGSEVTQVEMSERIMAKEDADAAEFVRQAMAADGVTLLTRHEALRCEHGADGEKRLVVRHPGGERTLAFDALLVAVGRSPRTQGFGLQELGIETGERGTLVTDEALRTRFPNILACGDVAGPFQFTHVAAHQAWYASVNALFGGFKRFAVDYSVIPWATFTDPEVARVGLSEDEAKAQGIAHEVTRYGLDEHDRAIADQAAHGWVKVLTEPGKDRILGATIVGEHAAELLAEFVLAMKHGIGLNKILGTIHTYPTMAEGNKYVAGEWKRAHKPERLLAFSERFLRWQRHEA